MTSTIDRVRLASARGKFSRALTSELCLPVRDRDPERVGRLQRGIAAVDCVVCDPRYGADPRFDEMLDEMLELVVIASRERLAR